MRRSTVLTTLGLAFTIAAFLEFMWGAVLGYPEAVVLAGAVTLIIFGAVFMVFAKDALDNEPRSMRAYRR